MLKMMVNNNPNVTPGNKLVGMMEALPLAVLDKMPSPRILSTHVKVQYLPKVIVLQINQSVENAGVAFVKGVDERNKFFKKINNQ